MGSTQAASDSPSAAEITAILTAEVKRHPAIRLAILYGSQARGTQRPDSDIDLAVAADDRTPLNEETLIDVSVASSLQTGREVQLRDLARAQGLFLKEVLTTGVVIYQRDPEIRGRLIIRMLDFVEDFQPIVSMIRRSKRERFLAGQ
ncbi:MAG: nucleotidyltransferase domain-containing protein [Alkalispirochaeta sp.]